jgi:hypothetical protein
MHSHLGSSLSTPSTNFSIIFKKKTKKHTCKDCRGPVDRSMTTEPCQTALIVEDEERRLHSYSLLCLIVLPMPSYVESSIPFHSERPSDEWIVYVERDMASRPALAAS